MAGNVDFTEEFPIFARTEQKGGRRGRRGWFDNFAGEFLEVGARRGLVSRSVIGFLSPAAVAQILAQLNRKIRPIGRAPLSRARSISANRRYYTPRKIEGKIPSNLPLQSCKSTFPPRRTISRSFDLSNLLDRALRKRRNGEAAVDQQLQFA